MARGSEAFGTLTLVVFLLPLLAISSPEPALCRSTGSGGSDWETALLAAHSAFHMVTQVPDDPSLHILSSARKVR